MIIRTIMLLDVLHQSCLAHDDTDDVRCSGSAKMVQVMQA